MNLTVTLQLDNFPPDADPDEVVRVLRSRVCEWLDFDRHPRRPDCDCDGEAK